MQNKYKNIPCIIDGIKFQSKKEGARYCELALLEKAGIVAGFTCQPSFVLRESYIRCDGKKIRPITYIADFAVIYPDGHTEIEDVKGVQTEVFKIKRKLLEAKYNLILKIV